MKTTVWTHLRKPLFALSIGLNLAFIAVWLVRSPSVTGGSESIFPAVVDRVAVPSALHREIGVTEEQWKRIAPLVLDFREKSDKQRRKISALRGQIMELLAMAEVGRSAIRRVQDEILSQQRQMQTMVIDHLLEEKKILSPEQAKKLIHYLREQCRQGGGTGVGKGIGRVLNEKSGVAPDKEAMESP